MIKLIATIKKLLRINLLRVFIVIFFCGCLCFGFSQQTFAVSDLEFNPLSSGYSYGDDMIGCPYGVLAQQNKLCGTEDGFIWDGRVMDNGWPYNGSNNSNDDDNGYGIAGGLNPVGCVSTRYFYVNVDDISASIDKGDIDFIGKVDMGNIAAFDVERGIFEIAACDINKQPIADNTFSITRDLGIKNWENNQTLQNALPNGTRYIKFSVSAVDNFFVDGSASGYLYTIFANPRLYISDDVGPAAEGVSVNVADGAILRTYNEITINVTFDEYVYLNGSKLRIKFDDNNSETNDRTVDLTATTVSDIYDGTKKSIATFKYLIPSDESLDGKTIEVVGWTNSSVIKDYAGNSLIASNNIQGKIQNKTIKIDTISPQILSLTSSNGDSVYSGTEVINFQLKCSEPVHFTDSTSLTLFLGNDVYKEAEYISGDGTDTFSYRYVVAEGDNSTDLDVALLNGTIKDLAGFNLNNTLFSSFKDDRDIRIDTQPPSISFGGETAEQRQVWAKAHGVVINTSDNINDPNNNDIYYYWSQIAIPPESFEEIIGPVIIANGADIPKPSEQATGEYYLHVKAIDMAGNYSVDSIGVFKFDNEIPLVSVTPQSGDGESSYTVSITATDDKSGINETRYWWNKDGVKGQEFILENGNLVQTPDMDGVYTLTVEAKDNANNIKSYTSESFVVDRVSPSVTFLPGGSNVASNTAESEVTIIDEKSFINSGYYQWTQSVVAPDDNDENWTEFFTLQQGNETKTKTQTLTLNNNSNGVWYLHIKCEDVAGNKDTFTSSQGFILDNENPSMYFSPDGTISSTKEFSTNLIISNENNGYEIKYEITNQPSSSFDENVLNEYIVNNGQDILFEINNNATDTYYIHVKVTDTAGNSSTISSKQIYIDNTCPTGGIDSTCEFTNKETVQLMLEAMDIFPVGSQERLEMRLSIDRGTSWLDFEGQNWIPKSDTKQINLPQEGIYDISVQYRDEAHNESVIYTCQVNFEKNPPILQETQYNSAWTNQNLSVVIIPVDDYTDTDSISIELLGYDSLEEVTLQGDTLTFRQNGSCDIRLKDLAGNESICKIEISNIDKEAPTLGLNPDGISEPSQMVTTHVLVEDNVSENSNINVVYAWSLSNSQKPSNGWVQVGPDRTIQYDSVTGVWYLWLRATDELGNISEYSSSNPFVLDNTDPEVLSIGYNPNQITANDVTARVVFSEAVRVLEPVETNSFSESFEYTFVENGTINVIYFDRAGNQNSKTLTVDWIDKSIPSAYESYLPNSWTNGTVNVLVSSNEPSDYSLYDFRPIVNGNRVSVSYHGNDNAIAKSVYNWNNDTGLYLADSNDNQQTVTNYVYSVELVNAQITGDGAVTDAVFEFTENAVMTYKIMKLGTLVNGNGEIVVDKIDKKDPTASFEYTSGAKKWSALEDEMWTNQDVQVEIKARDNSGQPVDILNNNGSSFYIFDNTGDFTFIIGDEAGNETSVTASVYKIDKVAPTATLSYTSGDNSWIRIDDEIWTNQDVEVALTATDDSNTPVEIINNGGSNRYTFSNNGSFTFRYRDMAGNEAETTATVSKIDKLAPTPTVFYDTQQWTNQDVNVWIEFDIEEEATILNNEGSNKYKFTESGAFTFEFEDHAGNQDEITVVVNNIDKEIPEVNEIWYSTNEPTNGEVSVKIYANEDVEFSTDNGNDSFTFNENGSHEFIFNYRADNQNSVIVSVNNIDKTPPTAWIDYSTTTKTNEDVIATIRTNEDIYVLNNNTRKEYVFKENGSFTFRYQDLAGNSGEIEAGVDNIDKTLPSITLEYSETQPTQENVVVTIVSDKPITPVNYTEDVITFTENTVKWLKATDEFGVEFDFQIVVDNIDRQSPVFDFTEGENLILELGKEFDLLKDVLITDNIDEHIDNRVAISHSIDINTECKYDITYSVSDLAGNSTVVNRKAIVIDSEAFNVFINTNKSDNNEIVSRAKGINVKMFGIEGDVTIKWLEGKRNRAAFKGCDNISEDGYLDVTKSGYYTLYIQDQERNSRLCHVYIIYSE